MPSFRYWRRRTLRHCTLAALSLSAGATLYVALASDDPLWKLSMATAYVGLALLGVSLAIGPWNVLRRRPNPVSTDLRRDVGIWAGLVSLAHLGVGLFVHFRGRPWLYFVYPPDQPHALPIRYDLFGFANHTGLVAGTGLAILLFLSNDRSLARLGAAAWKGLQRLAYPAAVLTVVHAVAYQVVEDRWRLPALIAALVVIVIGVAALQGMGAWRLRASGVEVVARRADPT